MCSIKILTTKGEAVKRIQIPRTVSNNKVMFDESVPRFGDSSLRSE